MGVLVKVRVQNGVVVTLQTHNECVQMLKYNVSTRHEVDEPKP